MMISCNCYLYNEGFVGIAPRIRVICSYNFTHGGVLTIFPQRCKIGKRIPVWNM